MSYIIVDTEYTTWPGALGSGWSMPGQHREIVQLAAIMIDAGRETASLDILVRPKLNPDLSALFTELTGITQDRVDGVSIAFPEALTRFQEFTQGWSIPIICMQSDGAVMAENCAIHDIAPPPVDFHRLVPYLVESGVNLQGMNSGDLHRLTDNPLGGRTHDALHDVRSMARWLEQADMPASLVRMPTDLPQRDHRRVMPDNTSLTIAEFMAGFLSDLTVRGIKIIIPDNLADKSGFLAVANDLGASFTEMHEQGNLILARSLACIRAYLVYYSSGKFINFEDALCMDPMMARRIGETNHAIALSLSQEHAQTILNNMNGAHRDVVKKATDAFCKECLNPAYL